MPKKTRFVGSRLFKVIMFGINHKGIWDALYLFVIVTWASSRTVLELQRLIG